MKEEKPYFVHKTCFIDPHVVIGAGTKIWHFCHLMAYARIGRDCTLGQNVFIGQAVQVGHSVKIQNNVSVYTGVYIEDEVFVGPSVVFTNVINPRSHIDRKKEFRKTWVNKGATLGANSTVLCGTTLGKYCFIGAGSVVTKDVQNYALMIGNPARHAGWMSAAGEKLVFDHSRTARCPTSQQMYRLDKDGVHQIED